MVAVVQAVCEYRKRQGTSGPGSTGLSHRPSGRAAVFRTPDQRSVAESPFIERVRSILMTPRGVCLQCRSDVSVLDRHASTVDECHVSSPPIRQRPCAGWNFDSDPSGGGPKHDMAPLVLGMDGTPVLSYPRRPVGKPLHGRLKQAVGSIGECQNQPRQYLDAC
jgi:hypothetical protein